MNEILMIGLVSSFHFSIVCCTSTVLLVVGLFLLQEEGKDNHNFHTVDPLVGYCCCYPS